MHATTPKTAEKAMVISTSPRLQFAHMARVIPRGRCIDSKARYNRKECRKVPCD